MVKAFRLSRIPQIYFGAGKIAELPSLIRQFGSKVFVATGEKSFLTSIFGNNLFEVLKDNNIVSIHEKVAGEPSPGLIDRIVAGIRHSNIDVVVAIGGGSVMDAGKAVSAMIPVQGRTADYLEGVGSAIHPGYKIPFIAVPTTAGTGSEATKNAVLSEIGSAGFKRSLRHENFIPEIALIDPGLTLRCPPKITAASGLDCMTQLIEAYLSDKSGTITDAFALDALVCVRRSLVKACSDGSDPSARSDMSYAALLSGICLANAGLGAVHGFASSLGAFIDIPHGIICGTLMAKANEVNIKILRGNNSNPEALAKYAALGRLFLDEEGKSSDYYIDGLIAYLHELTLKLDLPHLGKYGLEAKDADVICCGTDIKNNPVKLSVDDLKEILLSRL